MADSMRTEWTNVRHQRRASDRAAERVSRATDRGDATALRIASSQLEALIRRRAEHAPESIIVATVDTAEASAA